MKPYVSFMSEYCSSKMHRSIAIVYDENEDYPAGFQGKFMVISSSRACHLETIPSVIGLQPAKLVVRKSTNLLGPSYAQVRSSLDVNYSLPATAVVLHSQSSSVILFKNPTNATVPLTLKHPCGMAMLVWLQHTRIHNIRT